MVLVCTYQGKRCIIQGACRKPKPLISCTIFLGSRNISTVISTTRSAKKYLAGQSFLHIASRRATLSQRISNKNLTIYRYNMGRYASLHLIALVLRKEKPRIIICTILHKFLTSQALKWFKLVDLSPQIEAPTRTHHKKSANSNPFGFAHLKLKHFLQATGVLRIAWKSPALRVRMQRTSCKVPAIAKAQSMGGQVKTYQEGTFPGWPLAKLRCYGFVYFEALGVHMCSPGYWTGFDPLSHHNLDRNIDLVTSVDSSGSSSTWKEAIWGRKSGRSMTVPLRPGVKVSIKPLCIRCVDLSLGWLSKIYGGDIWRKHLYATQTTHLGQHPYAVAHKMPKSTCKSWCYIQKNTPEHISYIQ